jgi:hypothetical protein
MAMSTGDAMSEKDGMDASCAMIRIHAETAQRAFEWLEAGERVDSMLVARKFRQALKIRGKGEPLGGSADHLLGKLFKNHSYDKIFSKCVHAVQKRGSDTICVFSDVYDINASAFEEFARMCTSGGLDTRVFVVEYPEVGYHDAYKPPATIKSVSRGNRRILYRGKLVGVVF